MSNVENMISIFSCAEDYEIYNCVSNTFNGDISNWSIDNIENLFL